MSATTVIDMQEHLAVDRLENEARFAAKLSREIVLGKDVHLTSMGEGFSFVENGLYNFLDEITEELNFDRTRIKIDTWNLLEKHEEYNINRIPELYAFFMDQFADDVEITNPNSNLIGLFLGKANHVRLHVHEKIIPSLTWRDRLSYTFHQNLNSTPWPNGIKEYLMAGGNYSRLLDSLPVNDLKQEVRLPIIHPENLYGLRDAYRDIVLEIVLETSTQFGFFVTEKTLRPMYYGRPFLVVGPPHYEENLEKLGFDLDFGFPKWLRNFHHVSKADEIFKFLSKWITSTDVNVWYQSLIPKLKNNQRRVIDLARAGGKIDLSLLDN